jgi:hypothetical protein
MKGKTAFIGVVGVGGKDGGKSARRRDVRQLQTIGKARKAPWLPVAVETYIIV